MGHMSQQLKVPIEDLCQRISFPLYRTYGHAYDAFQKAEAYVSVRFPWVWSMLGLEALCVFVRLERREPDAVFAGLTMTAEERSVLLKKIQHSMTPQVGGCCVIFVLVRAP